jgi:hypothetical protein
MKSVIHSITENTLIPIGLLFASIGAVAYMTWTASAMSTRLEVAEDRIVTVIANNKEVITELKEINKSLTALQAVMEERRPK